MNADLVTFAHDDADIRSAVRNMLAAYSAPEAVRAAESAALRTDSRLWAEVTRGGWHALGVDAAHGGTGGTFADLHLVLHEMGRSAAAVPMRSAAVGVGVFLSRLFSDQPSAVDLVRRVAAGEIWVPAIDEGTACEQLPRWDADEGTVSGRVRLVRDAAAATGLLVAAAGADDQVHWLAVPTEQAELVPQPSLGEDAVSTVVLRNAPAAEVALGHHDTIPVWSALRWFAEACWVSGLMARAIEIAVDHARQREQFGRPIGSFQAVQHLLADCAIAVQSTTHLCRATAYTLDAALDPGGDVVLDMGGAAVGDAVTAAAEALESVRQHARVVSRNTHQVLGGTGYALEHDLQLFTRRIRSALLWGIDSESLRELILCVRYPDHAGASSPERTTHPCH